MRVLVTGASGFVGEAVVASALRAGHEVVAMVRPTARLTAGLWSSDGLEVLRGDLREFGAWTSAVGDVDAVVHLAAAPSGDLATQFQGTVVGTERLLAALEGGRVRRFVHVSSFSVYDFDAMPVGGLLDESSPLETRPERRDAYTTTKLVQERIVREACAARGLELVVVRPGAIFGPGKDWAAGITLGLAGRVGLVMSPRSVFPTTYVDNCADAMVAAISAPAAAGGTYNLVDDDLPTQWSFHRAVRRHDPSVPAGVPMPWVALRGFGRLVALVDRVLLGGGAKVPEFASVIRQQPRWKPLRYSNAAARRDLGWRPTVGFDDAVRRTAGTPAGERPAVSTSDRAHAVPSADSSAGSSAAPPPGGSSR